MKVVKQDLHCPACGVRDVWTDEDDSGDYYAGTHFYCLTCHACLPDLGGVSSGNIVKGSPSYGPDAFGLGEYIKIRDAACAVASITKGIRDLHAKACADQAERRRVQEEAFARHRLPSAAVHWSDDV